MKRKRASMAQFPPRFMKNFHLPLPEVSLSINPLAIICCCDKIPKKKKKDKFLEKLKEEKNEMPSDDRSIDQTLRFESSLHPEFCRQKNNFLGFSKISLLHRLSDPLSRSKVRRTIINTIPSRNARILWKARNQRIRAVKQLYDERGGTKPVARDVNHRTTTPALFLRSLSRTIKPESHTENIISLVSKTHHFH